MVIQQPGGAIRPYSFILYERESIMNHWTCMILASFSAIMAGAAAMRGNGIVTVAWVVATVCCLLDAFASRKGRE